MPMTKALTPLVLAALVSAAPLAPSAASSRALDNPGLEVVAELQQSLLGVWSDAGVPDFAARVQRLRPAVERAHDLDALARAFAGPAWERASDEEKVRLAQAIGDFCVASYAAAFARPMAASFERLGAREQDDGTVVVESVLARPEGRPMRVDYLLHHADDGWRIINATVNGVDRLAVQKSAFFEAEDGPDLDLLLAGLSDETACLGASAMDVVGHLHEALLSVMRDAKALGFRGRVERLAPAVDATHDVPAIARLTVKEAWEGWSAEDRERFEQVFRELIVATYAGRFDGYNGEGFARQSEEDLRREGKQVKATITKSNGQVVHFDYLLHRSEGRWTILNIVADGVSDLATKRAEYRSVLKARGLDGLIRKLRDQIARYAAGEKDD
jgi:phospholipid transport system substrate-binding protein